jgi:RNase H-fold protein (predicted Holliday junction resolvase)|tara:strand:+ start:169 stop:612 length:444 start_codon:yes stop_codon:yes gene_type:complete
MTQDVCAVGVSVGVQTFGIGISGGKHAIDKNCERLKLARILNDFGMKVAAVAILCQDERVFESMIQAGTPCPIDGKIGKEAKQLWSKYDHERPDYNTYVKRMDDRRKADEAEQKRITAELEAMDKAKAEEDRKKANAEKMKDWKHPR